MDRLLTDKLKELIATDEGYSLEFKRTTAHLGRISRPRNPLLFSLMERMDLVENIGSGIKRMRDAMREYGCSKLIIETSKSWFSISFPRLVKEGKAGEVAGEVTGEVTGEVMGEMKMLLNVLTEPLGRVALQQKLKLKGQANFRELYLTPALKYGLIEMTIPDKPTSRLQKYRITEKGEELLKK